MKWVKSRHRSSSIVRVNNRLWENHRMCLKPKFMSPLVSYVKCPGSTIITAVFTQTCTKQRSFVHQLFDTLSVLCEQTILTSTLLYFVANRSIIFLRLYLGTDSDSYVSADPPFDSRHCCYFNRSNLSLTNDHHLNLAQQASEHSF